ncbi:tyrosine-type recombinase/integrase [Altererythrobacter sp. SALINAS58]|uniref:site-specific integrase n=1 Tax=Alteripontixanthobacter muriae TaxID=2705546 RepID=UPI0015765CCB|nr:site-specific integrase [Alteripontixanthobacter muriae]NTZ43619.1 tyrosine-type recombinase/integrase [Alteripontixanthobacter muriae]
MARRKLNKSIVDRLQAREREYVEWCGVLRGFGCRVRPSGVKSLIAQYRVGGRNSAVRKVTICKYGVPGCPSYEEARKEAEKVLARAKLGDDVAAQKAKDRAEMTVAQLCDDYVVNGSDHKKPSTNATDKGRIERHIKKLLGSKRIGEVTRADVEKFLRDVADGKTATDEKTGKFGRAIVKGGKGTATRTVRLLGGIFSYAVARGYIEKNPRIGVKVYADGKGERYLSAMELEQLGEVLREAETTGLPWQLNDSANSKHRPKQAEHQREIISEHAIAAIRLLLLTGCRAGEILNLKWSQVDFERGFLNLADSKTGAKTVLLGAPALQILAELPRIAGNPYVIVGERKGRPRSDLKRPWKRITSRAGLHDLRLHDLRHSYASVGAASGMGLGIIGKLLGHASPATTARYSHFADDPLRRASNSIAATIAAALAGPAEVPLAHERPADHG